MSSDKPYRPSAKKLREARKKGQSPKSQIFTAAVSFVCGIITLFSLSQIGWVSERMLLNSCFASDSQRLGQCAQVALRTLASLILPVLGASAAGGAAAEILQSGFQFQIDLVRPRADQLNIVKGISRLGNSLKRSWLNLVLVGATLGIFSITFGDIPLSFAVLDAPPDAVWSSLKGLIGVGCLTLMVGGGIDIFVTRRRFMREMSMTLEEVRREHKEEDGDPHIKSMRRALHRQLLLSDLKQRVRRAKVVVVSRR